MNLELQFYGTYGIPFAASTLAYDSIQRLLLVATTDGRIKLVGTACIDRTLVSNLGTATVSLHVLPNTGCFLRLDVTGTLELWSILKRKCLHTLDPPGISDNITACCPLTHTPFVLVGCTSGALRVVGMLNAAGELVGPSRPVEGLEWMGYEMLYKDLQVPEDMELQEIACMHYGEHDLQVLLRHENNMVTALSMAGREVLGQAKCGGSGFKAHMSEVTAICWASHTLTQILTGHQDGSIVHWRLQNGRFDKCREYFILDDDQRDAIYNLSMVFEPSMSIVVCGGNMADAPQSVSLIHVDPVDIDGETCPGDVREISHIPWLGRLQGFALVRPRGSLKVSDAPTGVIALTEGGYMCIHDIASGKTEPFVGDFQANAVVSTRMVLIPRLAGSTHGFIFEVLKARAPPASTSAAWHWALHSGALHAEGLDAGAVPAQEVLMTGHDNGNVVLWDVSHVTPQRLSVLSCGCKAMVTSISLEEATGLLAAGHSTGEVNVAFWSPDNENSSSATVLEAEHSNHAAQTELRGQCNANWLHVLHIKGSDIVPGVDLSVVDMAWFVHGQPMTVWLAVAWAGGQVGVVNFSKGPESPSWLWEQQATVEPIRSVSFMRVASKHDEDADLVLLVATADGAFRSLRAHTGDMLAPQWIAPKTKQPLVACLPLAHYGCPAQASDLDGHVSLVAGAGGWRPLSPEDEAQSSAAPDALDNDDPGASMSSSAHQSPKAPRTGEDAGGTLETHPAADEEAAAPSAEAAATEGASADSDSGADDDDEDWEEQLEAAAKEEKKKRLGGKAGIRGFLANAKRLTAQVGSVAKDAKEAASESISSMSKRRSPKLDSGALGTEGSTSAHYVEAASDAGVEAQDHQQASTKHKSMTSSLALMGLPSTAEWLLIVTKSTVRLYPASAALSGKSRTVDEVNLDDEIDCAGALAVPSQKPMLVGWGATSGLQMISLPALDGAASQSLQRITGWQWKWKSDPIASKHVKRLFATCAPTGLISLVGPCRELLMLGLNRNRPDLLTPDAFFDPDLASAAFSAECHNAPSTSTLGESPRKKHADSHKHDSASNPRRSIFKGMEKKFKDTVGIDSPRAQAADTTFSQSNGPVHCCGASPELQMLLQSGHLNGQPSPPAPRSPAARPSVPQPSARPSPAAPSASPSPGVTKGSPSKPVGVRSAAEIKEAYGYGGRAAAAHQGAAGTKEVMAENISRLQQRQERLSRLDDRTAEMASDAEGFAAMAKKLAQQQSKPWWKF